MRQARRRGPASLRSLKPAAARLLSPPRRQLAEQYGWNLNAWRKALEKRGDKAYAEGFAVLDADGGAGWQLLCNLIQCVPRLPCCAVLLAARPPATCCLPPRCAVGCCYLPPRCAVGCCPLACPCLHAHGPGLPPRPAPLTLHSPHLTPSAYRLYCPVPQVRPFQAPVGVCGAGPPLLWCGHALGHHLVHLWHHRHGRQQGGAATGVGWAGPG